MSSGVLACFYGLQMKANARCVLDMVDVIPCIGGATVSLLDVPHFDCTVRLFNGPDLMALPGIKEATKFIIEVWLQCSTAYFCRRACVHMTHTSGAVDALYVVI